MASLVRRSVAVATAASIALAPAIAAAAGPGECHLVDVAYQPTVRTDLSPGVQPGAADRRVARGRAAACSSTRSSSPSRPARYGLGNRPGRFDFNSGPLWPYGRRITTFPVWAHSGTALELLPADRVPGRRREQPLASRSTRARASIHFCRPMQADGAELGRADLRVAERVVHRQGHARSGDTEEQVSAAPGRRCTRRRWTPSSVDMFAMLNPFDAVSQATPPPGVVAEISWPIPDRIAARRLRAVRRGREGVRSQRDVQRGRVSGADRSRGRSTASRIAASRRWSTRCRSRSATTTTLGD